MASDPTMEFLSRLNEPGRWVINRAVPIFRPHRRVTKDKDGKEIVIEVTEADLPEIAANMLALEQDEGVVIRVTPGHVRTVHADGTAVKETENPPLFGFNLNPRVGTFGPKNTPAVLVDEYLFPDRADERKNYPYRSAEYFHGPKVIRGVALLKRDPFLDLGMVTYDAAAGCYHYAMGSDMADEKTAANPVANPEEGKAQPPAETPEEAKLFEKMREYLCRKYALGDKWPAAESKKPRNDVQPDEEKPKVEVTPMETDKVPALYEQKLTDLRTDYERKLAEVKTEAEKRSGELLARLSGLELERDQERCQMLLYSLEREGFSFTAEQKTKELGKLCKTPAADREERVKELRSIYAEAKVPAGRIELYEGHVEGGSNPNDPNAAPWYHAGAIQHMLAHPGMQYEAACQHVQSTAAKK